MKTLTCLIIALYTQTQFILYVTGQTIDPTYDKTLHYVALDIAGLLVVVSLRVLTCALVLRLVWAGCEQITAVMQARRAASSVTQEVRRASA